MFTKRGKLSFMRNKNTLFFSFFALSCFGGLLLYFNVVKLGFAAFFIGFLGSIAIGLGIFFGQLQLALSTHETRRRAQFFIALLVTIIAVSIKVWV